MRLLQPRKKKMGVVRRIVLAFSLLEVLLRFAILRLKHGGSLSLQRRAIWLHEACEIIARRLSMSIAVSGTLPTYGLVVSNHLSYLDILLYAAVMPCIFVSKSEVLNWPMFGILARCGGTIFTERRRVHGVNDSARRIGDALRLGIPVMLFPEGTSTDGNMVLPFLSALFEPAIATNSPIHTAAIGYSVSDGVEADLCYYGEITFLPHLLAALAHDGVEGRIAFGDQLDGQADRKLAAKTAWKDVVLLREKMSGVAPARN
jgi:lyso-ornithine lipid O-acyltransferase